MSDVLTKQEAQVILAKAGKASVTVHHDDRDELHVILVDSQEEADRLAREKGEKALRAGKAVTWGNGTHEWIVAAPITTYGEEGEHYVWHDDGNRIRVKRTRMTIPSPGEPAVKVVPGPPVDKRSMSSDLTHDDLKAAIDLATFAHAGQKRREPEADLDYVVHPLRVALALQADGHDLVTVIAAVLHDVVEDTSVDLDTIIVSFGYDVADAVAAVTKDAEDATYMDFIRRAKAHPRGRFIKAADIKDNLRSLPKGHGLRKRYIKALKELGT